VQQQLPATDGRAHHLVVADIQHRGSLRPDRVEEPPRDQRAVRHRPPHGAIVLRQVLRGVALRQPRRAVHVDVPAQDRLAEPA
jgi:hypothetical protein